jgi:hypothetical protein
MSASYEFTGPLHVVCKCHACEGAREAVAMEIEILNEGGGAKFTLPDLPIGKHKLYKIYTRIDYSPDDVRERELAAAIAQRDKAIEFLQVYRHDTPLGHQPYMLAHEVDLLLKECGK